MQLFVFNNDVDLPHWKIHIHWQNFCIKSVLDKFIWAKGAPQGCFTAVRLFRFYLMSMTSNRSIVDSDELGREINPVTC